MKKTKLVVLYACFSALLFSWAAFGADATEATASETPAPASTEGAPVAPVSETPAAPAKPAGKDLILKGDAKCTGCHDEADEPIGRPTMLELNPGVLAIGKTRHGVNADTRTPTCTDCHGKSEDHVNFKGKGKEKPPSPDRSFRKITATPAAERSDACLECHQKDSKRHLWIGSAHESHGVGCNSCHQVHAAHDKVRDKRTQAEVCFTCHKEQRAQVNKQSHHPILEGKVTCSDCHNAHGSAGPKLMKRDSVVETCYTCHMEKRGPFVHNHQPVSDDCSNCHMPHGTTADNLLKARPPLVCYQCHSGHGTPGIAGIAPGVTTSAKANTFIEQGRGCLNCHTEIHGSNNPNGGQNLLPPAFFLR